MANKISNITVSPGLYKYHGSSLLMENEKNDKKIKELACNEKNEKSTKGSLSS